MNKPIRMLAIGCAALFLALLGRATFVQYWQADGLNTLSEHGDNIRVRDAEFSRDRGAILVNGKAIADSVPSDDKYKFQREYANPRRYAHITGYFSRDWGIGGVEATQNSLLSGSDSSLFLKRVVDLVDNQEPKGGSVELTINPAAQNAAYDKMRELGDDISGAVVAIEPATGRILAMVSSPTFDPNRLASHDFATVGDIKNGLAERRPSPLNNAAIETVLPPGSTFKLVTAAAALDTGRYSPDSMLFGGANLDLPQSTSTLPNHDGRDCGGQEVTMTQALMVSCNTAFGSLAMKVGPEKLRETSERFGFGQRYFDDLDDALTRQAVSRFPEDPDEPQTALTGIGQFDVAATPLQMAMVTAGIANNGTVMEPYLVDETTSPDLDVLSKRSPEPLPNQPAISSSAARDLRRMMVAVVDNGTATTAQIPGVEVGGKTGTAQSQADRPPYAWFTSMAPAENARVAVAVVIQDAGVDRDDISGSGLAAPIAKAVMQAVLDQ